MTRRALPLLLVLTGLLLGLSACGGGGGGSAGTTGGAATTGGGGGGGGTLQLAADPSGALKFDQTSLEATAGSVTIDLTNDSSLAHDVAVKGNGVDEKSDTVTGGSTSLTVDLQPGTYTFYCSVDGHRAAGMEGKLVVK
jgi:plastocyanin